MSWDNITGESKIVSSGGGNANEIILESGKAKRIRLLIPGDSQPYSYLEHCLEVESVDNGQVVRTFRTIRCPKTSKNPNAPCPLCDGQQVRRRPRHAVNAWDFDEQAVRKLNQGDGVFKPIATTRKLGVNILNVDWALMRTGETRNDTEYTATNLGPSDFVLPADAVLYDIESEYAPHTIDEMKAIVDGAGGNWDALVVPPLLTYPSLQDALNHKMPNGKYKDQTMKQIWDADKSPRGMINYLATKSDRVTLEKAAAQVIMVNLGGANIPGVPRDGQATTAPVQNTTPAQTTAPTQAPAPQSELPQAPPQNTVADGRQEKINKINSLFASKERFVKGSFQEIINTLQKCGNGKNNIVDFTDAELDVLLQECENA